MRSLAIVGSLLVTLGLVTLFQGLTSTAEAWLPNVLGLLAFGAGEGLDGIGVQRARFWAAVGNTRRDVTWPFQPGNKAAVQNRARRLSRSTSPKFKDTEPPVHETQLAIDARGSIRAIQLFPQVGTRKILPVREDLL